MHFGQPNILKKKKKKVQKDPAEFEECLLLTFRDRALDKQDTNKGNLAFSKEYRFERIKKK